VILFDQPPTNGTGCSSGLHDITFDDDSARLLYTCCTQLFSGVYKPQGPLAEFMGDSPSANWTLIVSDQVDDKNYGYIVSWGLNFTMSECTKAWVWQNMSWASKPAPGSDLPPARYQASTLVYGTHIYLFGGRDEYDAPLRDLYRFDTNTSHWLRLTPAHFGDAFKAASSVGANFVLTPLGLVRYGGYFRQPFQTTSGTNAYEDAVYFMDINTMRWQRLTAVPWPAGAADGSGGGYQSPPGRYYGGMVFVSSKYIKWRRDFSYRALFDQLLPSTHANFVGSMVDSLLLFGGFNGAAGSVNDGSTGGFLNDVWMLRLTNWSTPGALDQLRDSVQADCAWRQDQYMRSTCLSTVVGAKCSFREILLLARCSLTNLTMA
jgi:Kelch motif